jgi:hypothetical protein
VAERLNSAVRQTPISVSAIFLFRVHILAFQSQGHVGTCPSPSEESIQLVQPFVAP